MCSSGVRPEMLARQWAEIHEEKRPGYLVWREVSVPMPPTRKPRRRLCLHADGHAELLVGSPTDSLQREAEGCWSCGGRVLHLTLPGWEGDYEIETLALDTLVLCRR